MVDIRGFGGMLKINLFTTFFDLLYIAIGLATLLFSPGYLEKKGGVFRGEYPVLIIFSVIGMMLMTRANDLLILFSAPALRPRIFQTHRTV